MENISPFIVRKNREEKLVSDLQDSISSIQLNREDVAEFLRSELFYLSSTYPQVFRASVSENDDVLLNIGGSKDKNINLTLYTRELYDIKLRIRVRDVLKIYTLEERANNLPGYQLTNIGEDTFDLQNTIIDSDLKFTLINLFTTKAKEWSRENSDLSFL